MPVQHATRHAPRCELCSANLSGMCSKYNPWPPLSSRPLYESSRLADPYIPFSVWGELLDFDYPQVLCNNRGQGTVRLLGVPFY